jgi:pilus assembly protein Flp/PilA
MAGIVLYGIVQTEFEIILECNWRNFYEQNENKMIKLFYIFLSLQVNIYSERNSFMLFSTKEQGQGLVEYAIILVLVAIVVIAVVRLLGPEIGNTFSSINSSL